MRLSTILGVVSLVSAQQFYPLNKKGEIPNDITPYEPGQTVLIDCIARNIDNGEHKFDDQDRIVYTSFPVCKETGKPLNFKYGVSEDVNCTIGFTDELYHLFQLYMHEDVPFSCRLPLSSEPNYLEKGGAYVPLTFNFRGEIHDSHLDIDHSVNVLITKPHSSNKEENTFISAIAFSSGTNATRIVIGDYLTLNLAVRWYDSIVGSNSNTNNKGALPFNDGFYKFPTKFIPIGYSLFYFYLVLVALVAGSIVYALTYHSFTKKMTRGANGNIYKPIDGESAFGKLD